MNTTCMNLKNILLKGRNQTLYDSVLEKGKPEVLDQWLPGARNRGRDATQGALRE